MKKHGILISVRKAEATLRLLRKLGFLDNASHPIREGDKVLLPLVRELSKNESQLVREQIEEVVLTVANFTQVRRRPRSLAEALSDVIPAELIQSLPRSLDVIGDVSIVELPKELEGESSKIGEGILKVNPHIRLVLRKRSETTGRFRTRKLEVIAGSGSTETLYHEFSCKYRLDVSSVYFNPRLSHERMRVARQVKAGESVVDMFAGVGPYSILIARLQPSSTVYSVDVNPEAVKYLKDNVFRNQVGDRVIPILRDVRELADKALGGLADRIIMNLPSEAINYLGAASHILKPQGGMIHFYAFASRREGSEPVESLLKSTLERHSRKVESIGFCGIIKEVGPNRVQVALDVFVK